MKKLKKIRKGRMIFYICKYDCGLYSIDRITKGFGGSVFMANTLEGIYKYMQDNGFKEV